jgi:hypothetical protein
MSQICCLFAWFPKPSHNNLCLGIIKRTLNNRTDQFNKVNTEQLRGSLYKSCVAYHSFVFLVWNGGLVLHRERTICHTYCDNVVCGGNLKLVNCDRWSGECGDWLACLLHRPDEEISNILTPTYCVACFFVVVLFSSWPYQLPLVFLLI